MARENPGRLSTLAAALLAVGLAVPLAAGAAGTTDKSTTSAAATASDRGATARASLSHGDRKFIEKAAQGSLAEVEFGKLAAQKASSSDVKQFGQRMADDHAKANAELQQLASGKGINLPSDLDRSQKREYDKLQKLSGADFDREYTKEMVSDHKKDVKEFQSASKNAKDGDVKNLAAKTLPTLEEHLKLAQSTESAVRNERTSAAAPHSGAFGTEHSATKTNTKSM